MQYNKTETAVYSVTQVVAASLIQHKASLEKAKLTEQDSKQSTPLIVIQIKDILDSGILLPLDKAEEIINYLTNNITLSILLGRHITDFTMKLVNELKDPTRLVPSFKMGILVWARSTYDANQKSDRAREDSYSSDYVGEVGEKLTLSLRISSSIIVQTPDSRYGSFIIPTVAYDENGNMFSFNSKNKLDVTEQYSYHITAKVKKHEINKYANNAKSTVLFYIKEVK